MKLLMTDTEVVVNGHKIFARFYKQKQFSQQTTLVFLHEALGSVAQWRDFPQKIGEATGFNVLIYDRLGHGLSDPLFEKRGIDYLHREAWEMTPSVLKHFNIEKPILFGHSDGATIALLFATRFPVKALISEAAHAFVEAITLKGIQDALPQKAFWIERLTRYHGTKTADLYAAWSDTWLKPTFKKWNILDLLPAISCPTLVIQGENDMYGTNKQVQSIAENIGNTVQTCLIPDCGHTPHWEAQEFVFEKVVSFLKALV